VDFATLCGYRATNPPHTIYPACAEQKGRLLLSPSEDSTNREQGSTFMPKFDANGLITAVAVEHGTGALLMLAHMNAEALAKTLETGFAYFYSRSRGRLWMKGETSGHVLKIVEIRVDCDQDALELRVEAAGPACHTMAPSCFYRRITAEGSLERIGD
jgi:phosphoribosyl-AMP cyclohydrolase